MSPRRHLDDLFSAAYDDDLSPIEEARFNAHMQSCAPCAAAYAEFRSTVEALREMPKARMPHVVHLPSTSPVAERPPRPRIGLGWFNLGVLRRFPATAIAGAFVVVLAVTALLHGGATPTSIPSDAAPASTSGPALHGEAGGTVPTTSCTSIVGIAGAGLPASFGHEDLATDPAQPAEHLILAAPTLQVTAGKRAVVYAELSVPVQSAVNPGTAPAPIPPRAAVPCVSVEIASSSLKLDILPAVEAPQPQGAGSTYAPSQFVISPSTTGPLLSFQVPPGLAPGTQLLVIATVPVGYTGQNSPPLTAELTLTTR